MRKFLRFLLNRLMDDLSDGDAAGMLASICIVGGIMIILASFADFLSWYWSIPCFVLAWFFCHSYEIVTYLKDQQNEDQ